MHDTHTPAKKGSPPPLLLAHHSTSKCQACRRKKKGNLGSLKAPFSLSPFFFLSFRDASEFNLAKEQKYKVVLACDTRHLEVGKRQQKFPHVKINTVKRRKLIVRTEIRAVSFFVSSLFFLS
jgi:hypothetical protein